MKKMPLYLCLAALSACGGSKPSDASKAAPAAAKVQGARPETELATVTLTAESEKHLAIQVIDAKMEAVAPSRTIGGEVIAPPGRSVVVTTPVAGVLTVPGGRQAAVGPVRKGEAIFELVPIQQSDLDPAAEAERAVREADAKLAEASQRLTRLEGLLKEGSTSVRSVEEARAAQTVAAATADAAKRRLTSLKQLPMGQRGQLALASPFDGLVTALRAVAGQTVPAGTPVAEVVQIDTVWVRVPVYAGEAGALDTGRPAVVARLGQENTGPWREAARTTGPPAADASGTSIDVFFSLSNAGAGLRPGERVSVRLPLKSAANEKALVVPQSAVIYDLSGGTWVYEQKAPHVFQRRRIEVAGQNGATVIVRRGLAEGAKIVSVGAAELYGTEFFVAK